MKKTELDEVVRIHLQQFPASRATRLGTPFVRKMYRWFIENQAPLALVAESDGQLLGCVVGAIGGYGSRITRYAVWQIAWGLATHPQMWFSASTFASWASYLRAFAPGSHWGAAAPPASIAVGAETVHAQTVGAASDPSPPPGVKASIASIAVAAEAQGQGVGKALMAAFEAGARQSGATFMTLSVHADNPVARRLYERSGWKAQHLRASDDSVYYVKEISGTESR
jgi:ribosomal protein S18 acetylase RimI-like enzyme